MEGTKGFSTSSARNAAIQAREALSFISPVYWDVVANFKRFLTKEPKQLKLDLSSPTTTLRPDSQHENVMSILMDMKDGLGSLIVNSKLPSKSRKSDCESSSTCNFKMYLCFFYVVN